MEPYYNGLSNRQKHIIDELYSIDGEFLHKNPRTRTPLPDRIMGKLKIELRVRNTPIKEWDAISQYLTKNADIYVHPHMPVWETEAEAALSGLKLMGMAEFMDEYLRKPLGLTPLGSLHPYEDIHNTHNIYDISISNIYNKVYSALILGRNAIRRYIYNILSITYKPTQASPPHKNLITGDLRALGGYYHNRAEPITAVIERIYIGIHLIYLVNGHSQFYSDKEAREYIYRYFGTDAIIKYI